jgi:hypothetical protein
LQNGANVNINNLPADNVQFVSATSITATTPGLPAGTADVTVGDVDVQPSVRVQPLHLGELAL